MHFNNESERHRVMLAQLLYGQSKLLMVRKVRWDQMWHVVYEVRRHGGQTEETYDRVDEKTALKIIKENM